MSVSKNLSLFKLPPRFHITGQNKEDSVPLSTTSSLTESDTLSGSTLDSTLEDQEKSPPSSIGDNNTTINVNNNITPTTVEKESVEPEESTTSTTSDALGNPEGSPMDHQEIGIDAVTHRSDAPSRRKRNISEISEVSKRLSFSDSKVSSRGSKVAAATNGDDIDDNGDHGDIVQQEEAESDDDDNCNIEANDVGLTEDCIATVINAGKYWYQNNALLGTLQQYYLLENANKDIDRKELKKYLMAKVLPLIFQNLSAQCEEEEGYDIFMKERTFDNFMHRCKDTVKEKIKNAANMIKDKKLFVVLRDKTDGGLFKDTAQKQIYCLPFLTLLGYAYLSWEYWSIVANQSASTTLSISRGKLPVKSFTPGKAASSYTDLELFSIPWRRELYKKVRENSRHKWTRFISGVVNKICGPSETNSSTRLAKKQRQQPSKDSSSVKASDSCHGSETLKNRDNISTISSASSSSSSSSSNNNNNPFPATTPKFSLFERLSSAKASKTITAAKPSPLVENLADSSEDERDTIKDAKKILFRKKVNSKDILSSAAERDRKIEEGIRKARVASYESQNPKYSLIVSDIDFSFLVWYMNPFRAASGYPSSFDKFSRVKEPYPCHIFCIIGREDPYDDVFIAIAGGKYGFHKLQTVSFLVTATFNENYVHYALPYWSVLGRVPVHYGKNDIREILVIASPIYFSTRNISSNSAHTKSKDYCQNPTDAFNEDVNNSIIPSLMNAHQNNGFRDFPEGVHRTSNSTLFMLQDLIQVRENELCWDVGIGEGYLAAYFSHISKLPTFGTEVDTVMDIWLIKTDPLNRKSQK